MASNRELSQLASLLEVADFTISTSTTIESLLITKYRSAKVTVQVTQGTDYQYTELIVLHDGTTATLLELASVASNQYLVTFSASVVSGYVEIDVSTINGSTASAKIVSQRNLL